MDDTLQSEEPAEEAIRDAAQRRRLRTLLAGVGAGLTGVAGVGLNELSYRRRLARNPEHQRLSKPLTGRPVAARSADGTLLHAEVFGPEQAPTFVLAPGWTENLYLFDSVTRRLLDAGFRVVGYDLRGQGHSNPPAGGDYDLARYGEDLEAVLGATCAGRADVIVVGHSMGGMSIVAWAAAHPCEGRIQAAALMNTGMQTLVAASRILPQILPEAAATLLARWAFLGNPLPVPQQSSLISRAAIRYVAFGPHATDAQVNHYERMLFDCQPAVRAGAGLALNNMDLMWCLPKLTVPTLVLSGREDRLTPTVQAEWVAAELPDLAELVELPGVGHMGPLEAPHLVVEALLRLHERTAVPVPEALALSA